uniref:Uncharacterized protein n=1 Tax=viral metagenome TaxID=1070528 RepID=A0A6C0HT41_9ZZZZ
MPKRNMFSSSSKSQMGSNAVTSQNQGGGGKKAGFPYIIGRTQWTNIAFEQQDGIKNLTFLMKTVNPKTSISRPIGSTYTPNTYFTVPGTR